MEALPGFILAGLALAGSPGPATLSLTATGAAFGARRGVAYLAGISVGMVAAMAIVAAVNIAWLAAGAILTRFLLKPRTTRAINVIFAVLLVASVGLALAV